MVRAIVLFHYSIHPNCPFDLGSKFQTFTIIATIVGCFKNETFRKNYGRNCFCKGPFAIAKRISLWSKIVVLVIVTTLGDKGTRPTKSNPICFVSMALSNHLRILSRPAWTLDQVNQEEFGKSLGEAHALGSTSPSLFFMKYNTSLSPIHHHMGRPPSLLEAFSIILKSPHSTQMACSMEMESHLQRAHLSGAWLDA